MVFLWILMSSRNKENLPFIRSVVSKSIKMLLHPSQTPAQESLHLRESLTDYVFEVIQLAIPRFAFWGTGEPGVPDVGVNMLMWMETSGLGQGKEEELCGCWLQGLLRERREMVSRGAQFLPGVWGGRKKSGQKKKEAAAKRNWVRL